MRSTLTDSSSRCAMVRFSFGHHRDAFGLLAIAKRRIHDLDTTSFPFAHLFRDSIALTYEIPWFSRRFAARHGAACSSAKTYEMRGQILGVNRDKMEILVKHDEIKGLMPP
jgi:hypothetical protein